MKIERLSVGPLRTNCYLVINEKLNECIIIDPGYDGAKIAENLSARGIKPVIILLTHGHCDHIQGVEELRNAFGVKVLIHEADNALLQNVGMNLSHRFPPATTLLVDGFVTDGDVLNFAGITLKVIHTPGHTKGGVCFHCEEAKALFAGDTLFCESVGRTDFPGGDLQTEVESIRNRLFVLPNDTQVFPGHGSATDIGNEKLYNPFLKGTDMFE